MFNNASVTATLKCIIKYQEMGTFNEHEGALTNIPTVTIVNHLLLIKWCILIY